MNTNTSASVLFSLALCITSMGLRAQEICNNGLDDDNDGLIDLNDTLDCDGNVINSLPYLLPNRSFELYDCLPTSYTELYCADTWSQATIGTSDYFRTESYMPSFIPQPLPYEGNGCVGGYICPDYAEYIGGCLTEPLLAGATYNLRISVAQARADNFALVDTVTNDLPPVELTVWGMENCPGWPVSTSLCPYDLGWYPIGTVLYTPDIQWSEVLVPLTPFVDVNAIMIGGPCEPVGYPSVAETYIAYELYDEMSVSECDARCAGMDGSGSICTGDMMLRVHPLVNNAAMQWYRNGIALAQQTDSTLDVSGLDLGEGTYQCRMTDTNGATIAVYHIDDPSHDVPLIEPFGNGLFCTSNGSYQWYFQGSEITGATGAYYEPYIYGSYTVQVTNGEGCSATSPTYFFLGAGVPTQHVSGYTVSIDPASQRLLIDGDGGKFTFALNDAAGRTLVAGQGAGPRWTMDLNGFPQGVYIVQVNGTGVRIVR